MRLRSGSHFALTTRIISNNDPPAGHALDEIASRRGLSRAEAARQAIAETAERERRRSGLAAEARRLMQNEDYVREARDVASLMETLRGPW